MSKKQKSIRGLKLGDRQNLIYNLISIGVCHTSDSIQDIGDADEVIQHAHKVDDDPHEAVDNSINPSNNE